MFVQDAVLGFVVTSSNASASRFSSLTGKADERTEFAHVKPVTEMAIGDTCNSLSWIPTETGNTMMASTNCKHMRLYDTGVSSHARMSVNVSSGKFVYGVECDPFEEHRAISYGENQLVLWDTRTLTPAVHINLDGKILKASFSPTRPGLLCVAVENSTSLVLKDIHTWSGLDVGESVVASRNIAPKAVESNLMTFSWHPSVESRIIALTKSQRFCDVEVTERICPAWSAKFDQLVWPSQGQLRISDKNASFVDGIEDISSVMRKIAKETPYGGCADMADNAQYIEKFNPGTAKAWKFVGRIEKMKSDLAFRNKFSRLTTIPGVRMALGLDKSPVNLIKADIQYAEWNVPHEMRVKPRKVYRHEARELGMKICGWRMDPNDLSEFEKQCVERGEWGRAAAIATFCLDINRALKVLAKGAEANAASDPKLAAALNMTAISLAGLNEDSSNKLWWDMIRSQAVNNLVDPYIRSIFNFFIENLDGILNDPAIELDDKIAFILLYLPEDKLIESLNLIWEFLLERGDLSAVILSGLTSKEGVELLQRYVDITCDVQTVAWLSARCLPTHLVFPPNPNPQPTLSHTNFASRAALTRTQPFCWMQSWIELLQTWALWIKRAEFDSAMGRNHQRSEVPKQCFVSCTQCGMGLTQFQKMPTQEEAKRAQVMAKQNPTNHKTNVCPSCQKPNPRCVVCQATMGTHAGRPLPGIGENVPRVVNCDFFISWCQTCRHGGHAAHLYDWFSRYEECPVGGCTCQCMTLDQLDDEEDDAVMQMFLKKLSEKNLLSD